MGGRVKPAKAPLGNGCCKPIRLTLHGFIVRLRGQFLLAKDTGMLREQCKSSMVNFAYPDGVAMSLVNSLLNCASYSANYLLKIGDLPSQKKYPRSMLCFRHEKAPLLSKEGAPDNKGFETQDFRLGRL